jgi:hypothetical protein
MSDDVADVRPIHVIGIRQVLLPDATCGVGQPDSVDILPGELGHSAIFTTIVDAMSESPVALLANHL